MKFALVHEFDNYHDYEPVGALSAVTPFGTLCRITFDDETHTAYGSIFNPEYRMENEEEISTGETVSIPWGEALQLAGVTTRYTVKIQQARHYIGPGPDSGRAAPTPQGYEVEFNDAGKFYQRRVYTFSAEDESTMLRRINSWLLLGRLDIEPAL